MTTRPSSMTPEEIERLTKSGVNVQLFDPRVTRATNWILGLVGAGLVTFLMSLNAQLSSQNAELGALREQNAALIAELRNQQQINQAQDSRLNIYDDRLRAVEKVVK
jgi:hypothetical protein